MPDRYVHTQRSHLLLLVLSAAAAVTLASLAFPSARTIPLGARLTIVAAALAMVVSGLVFSSLTITTDAEQLSWHFGAGLFRKSVPLAEVVSAEPVRTTWVDGWGIHLTWRGWLYNVAGHNAVRVSLRSGRQFLLGTDEPAALVEAIRNATRLSVQSMRPTNS
jgi:hypothetical protein